MAITPISEPSSPPAAASAAPWHAGHAVWQLGFRPFYLLAAVFAALGIPLWLASYAGWLTGGLQVGLGWHMHEMVFGFALAVVVGFLYTAGRNWTGLPTPHGAQLMALAGLWLAGRVAMLCGPGFLAALVDWLFLPLAAWPLYLVLRRSGNTRNLFLVGLLALLALANGLFHAAVLGWLPLSLFVPVQAAIFIIVLIESVIGARVIPMFTRNGAPGSTPVASPKRALAAVACMAAAAIAWLAGAPAWLTAPLAFCAAGVSLANLLAWQPQRTVRVPLLWILHLSYAWIGIGFALLAAASLGLLPASAALHALTVGSMAGLIIGMMTRTTLGHTGRPLKGGKAEAAMYWLIQLGALARLLAAVGPAALSMPLLLAAGACWSLAFGLYVCVYAPYLWRARVDGREG
ncbi:MULTISPECIES: NnrS family protein [unclassified Janthinobacterium]|uniref:NnrS family protein n=1 Tax=unclassified Janthinobacterium TaxID=2610881 RepID=UPI001E5E0E2B|nr:MULTISPECIES: NnrS family protein [unclassified Janthinobacterium]MCC7642622.1 NnrS family protein [Janthinobacterium sp. EB271-G4-3-1]MCC7689805.1 NnrS family protein [Janthinobacterium sp. EB271-G4-3-2]